LLVRPVDDLGHPLEGATGTVTLALESSAAMLRAGPLEAPIGPDGARFEDVVVDGTESGVRLVAGWSGHEGASAPFDVVLAFDRVLLGNAGAGVRGALVDGYVGGRLANDLGFLAEGDQVSVGSVQRSAGSNELIVFGDGHAPALVTRVPWTEGVDTVFVRLPEPVRVGITIWVVKGPFDAQRTRAKAAVERTTAIWSAERHGIEFSDVEYVDATADPDAPDFFSFDLCAKRAGAENRIGKRDGRLNIYYVERVDGGLDRGRACPIGGDFAVMAERTGDELMAHEIGHLFSLRHVDHLTDDFDRTNVMHSSSSVRRHLTEAQTFRAHFNAGSVINAGLDLRPDLPIRTCSREAADPGCPAIRSRLWADGGFVPNLTADVRSGSEPALAAAAQLVSRWLRASCMAEANEDLEDRLVALGDAATPLLSAAYRQWSDADGRAGADTEENQRRRLAALHGLGVLNTAYARSALLEVARRGPALERQEARQQLATRRER
jgi:hypothetical protein